MIAAAEGGFDVWSKTKPTTRGRILVKLADLIEQDAARLVEIEVRDDGKLYAEMFSQVKYTAEWYRYYGGLADKVEGAVIPTDKADVFNFTRYEPLGIIAMITPWNSPLLLLAWKLAAALAAGNVAVTKPSEFTSASTLEFMTLFEQAGFPPGVVNVLTGFGADVGSALVAHPKVAKIAFTGADVGGQKVLHLAIQRRPANAERLCCGGHHACMFVQGVIDDGSFGVPDARMRRHRRADRVIVVSGYFG